MAGDLVRTQIQDGVAGLTLDEQAYSKPGSRTVYLNVDLEIRSRSNLMPLVATFSLALRPEAVKTIARMNARVALSGYSHAGLRHKRETARTMTEGIR